MNKNNNLAYIILASILAVALAVAGLFIIRLREDNAVLVEQFALEKEQLEDEYTQLAIDYEGYKLEVNNDSLEQKLEDQRLKMQRLVEELKQTKAEDARKIAALKKELETVRGVLKYYIAQVDSLNHVNAALVAENQQVRREMATVRANNDNLQERNEKLNQQVTLAAQLVTTGLTAVARNKREKVTNSIKSTKDFMITFNIAANVTAQTGEKAIYLRILRPDDELLTNARSGTFAYENANIQYSTKKVIEYGGQETPVTLYWTLAETLTPGTLKFEIYADGSMIGSTTLSLKK